MLLLPVGQVMGNSPVTPARPHPGGRLAFQDPGSQPEVNSASLLAALTRWAGDFAEGTIVPAGIVDRPGGRLPARYREVLGAGGLLHESVGEGTLSHFDILRALLVQARRAGAKDPETGRQLVLPLMRLAAGGLSDRWFDLDAMRVRDAASDTLRRLTRASVRLRIVEIARGDRVRGPQGRGQVTADRDVQIAAIQQLGRMDHPLAKAVLAERLRDEIAPIRLAAAEAVLARRDREQLPAVRSAFAVERHPMVAQALVRTIAEILAHGEPAFGLPTRQAVATTVLPRLGMVDWRTDLAILDLIEMEPVPAAVPALIEVMARDGRPAPADGGEDLVRLGSQGAAPTLAWRAWQVLKWMTGVGYHPKEIDKWNEYWAANEATFTVSKRADEDGVVEHTRATFYGVPVTGREVLFLIDTSGSMNQPVWAPADRRDKPYRLGDPVRRSRPQEDGGGESRPTASPPRGDIESRLDAARLQLAEVVQSLEAGTVFHLVTFNDRVNRWTRENPLVPGRETSRTVTRWLGDFEAKGGTDLYGALLHAFDADERAAFGAADETSLDEIFILSDGLPTTGGVRRPSELLEEVAALNEYRQVQIHCVFTGYGDGSDFLKALAGANHGIFVHR